MTSYRASLCRACCLILALVLLSLCPAHSMAAPLSAPPPTYSDLQYGTYLGGSNYESYPSIGLDTAGNAYIAASTYSKDYPGVLIGGRSAEMATFAKISPDGRRLLYSGQIGGAGGTQLSQAITVAADGTSYIAGMTNAKDFPVTADNGGTACGRGNDAFLVILDPAGRLRYSGCWGGTSWDQPLDIALTPEGDVLIAGYTYSPDFPIPSTAFQPTYVDGYDAFVLRLHKEEAPAPPPVQTPAQPLGGHSVLLPLIAALQSPAALASTNADAVSAPEATVGSDEKWSVEAGTFLGGWGDDRAWDLAIGPDGSVLVTGQAGDNFPVTPGAYQTTREAGIHGDAFVTHLSADLTRAEFSTLFGGTANDYGKAVAFAPDGIVVTGLAKSDLPISRDAYDKTGDPDAGDVFVAALDPTGSRLLRSTYVGLTGQDEPTTLLVDDQGTVTLSGVSELPFPTTPGSFDPTYNGLADTWLCRLSPDFTDLTYGTLVGGSGLDGLRGFQGQTLRAPVARMPDDSFVLTTITFSPDWPITGTSFQPTLNRQWDLGIVRLRIGELRAVQTDAPPLIDGVFTGWRRVPGIVLNTRNATTMTLRPTTGNAKPIPPSLGDVSGRLQMQWDADALYFAASVADNDPLVPVGVGDAGGGPANLNGDHVELTIGLAGATRTFVYPSSDTSRAAFARLPNGWGMEAAIPAEALGLPLHALTEGQQITITWTIVDSDTGEAVQSLTLTTKVTL